jgi:hypothetical protein
MFIILVVTFLCYSSLLVFCFLIIVQIFSSLAKFSFLLHLLKCLCPQNSSSLLNFVGAKHVIILLHCIFIHHNCNVLASFLFIFILLSCFPIVVQVSFNINTCVFFLLSTHRKIMMINLIILLQLFWCLANYFFALYFVDACICATLFIFIAFCSNAHILCPFH